MRQINRRAFVRNSALGLGSLAAIERSTPAGQSRVRLGLIGLGLRGRNHLALLLRRPDVEVVALCDIDADALGRAVAMVAEAGRPAPRLFSDDEEAFRDLLRNTDLDGAIISTPWRWHVPMAVAALERRIRVGLEVPAAITVEGCWQLVRASEEYATPCMLLENVCYRRDVMAVLNMVRQGLFGELVHCQGGYQHDLRNVKFNDGNSPYGDGVEFGDRGFSEAKWRTRHSVERNGDLYPTHGLGPISTMLNINHGNRFVALTSTATKSRGLHNYIVEKGGADHPNAAVEFKLGDIVTTVIRCANGETIMLSHDTNLPRPYSLNFRVQGTAGLWMKDNDSIYLEGRSPDSHEWEPFEPYAREYDHPLWRRYGPDASGAGHGGMDFFVIHAFVESTKRRVAPPIDVYDAAAWSVIGPLSELSIANDSDSVEVPDFTGGRWRRRPAAFAGGDEF